LAFYDGVGCFGVILWAILCYVPPWSRHL